MKPGLTYVKTAARALDQNIETALSLYASGATAEHIGHHFGCSKATVLSRLKKAGLQPRPCHPPRFVMSLEDREEAKRLYAAGNTLGEIGTKFGCSHSTVVRIFSEMGAKVLKGGLYTEKAKAKMSGSNHPRWRDGQPIVRKGYRFVYCKGHPNAHHDYIREHRLVMEQYLLQTNPTHPALDGDHLRSDWDVHHVNRDRLDNRIENLEPLPKSMHTCWTHFEREVKRLQSLLEANGIAY